MGTRKDWSPQGAFGGMVFNFSTHFGKEVGCSQFSASWSISEDKERCSICVRGFISLSVDGGGVG